MLIFCCIGFSVSALLLVRNAWVFETRGAWLENDFPAYRLAVSYDEMMFRVWCWSKDIAKWQRT